MSNQSDRAVGETLSEVGDYRSYIRAKVAHFEINLNLTLTFFG